MIKIAKMRPLAERPLEYIEGTASEEIVLGEALVLASGKLTKCGATVVPTYIAMGSGNGTVIPVVRVESEDTYSAPLSVAGSSLKLGEKVTLHTDGLKVTATTASGVFEITKIHGTKPGDLVEGKFN